MKTNIAKNAYIIGDVLIESEVNIQDYAVIRGDGKSIVIKSNSTIGPYSTVHISTYDQGTIIGKNVKIGKYCVIHACTIKNGATIGDYSIIMDGSIVGEGTVVFPKTLITPNKIIKKNSVVSGSPFKTISTNCLKKNIYKKEIIGKISNFKEIINEKNINFYNFNSNKHLYIKNFKYDLNNSFIASNAILNGNILIGKKSSIWFSCRMITTKNEYIKVGEGVNIQDNSIIIAKDKNITIGNSSSLGHNVIIKDSNIGKKCLIGMGSVIENSIVENNSIVAANSFVENGTIVKSGTIYAGNPSKYLRKIQAAEKNLIDITQKTYKKYIPDYKGK